jgi:hypothetical protein
MIRWGPRALICEGVDRVVVVIVICVIGLMEVVA